MTRSFALLVLHVALLLGCADAELPPHNLSDDAVDFTIAEPSGFAGWDEDRRERWRQLEAELLAARARFLSGGEAVSRAGDVQPPVEALKRRIFLHDIETDKLLSTDPGDAMRKGPAGSGSSAGVAAPVPVSGPVIDPATLTGYEVFINVGGVAGSALEGPTTTALEAGYRAQGFRVNTITQAMRWAPVKQRMEYVASVYRQNGVELKYVVFHHGGHGWRDIISYESTQKNALGQYVKKRGVSTPHQTIFRTLASTFPKTDAAFPDTRFGVVLDACGQGNAVDRSVAGRSGFVATATPAFRWHDFKGESYYYSGTYIYSNYFGQFLQQASPGGDADARTRVLRDAHRSANRQAASALMGNGEYKAY